MSVSDIKVSDIKVSEVLDTASNCLHPIVKSLLHSNKTLIDNLARRVWKDFYPAVDAIVYIIDTSDISRLDETKSELLVFPTNTTLSQTALANNNVFVESY